MGDLADAVAKGDRAAALKALAESLAHDLEATHPKDVAHGPLAEQFRKTLTELEGLSDDDDQDAVDKLKSGRPKLTAVPARPTRGKQRRAASG